MRRTTFLYTAPFVLCIIGYLLVTVITPPDSAVLTRYDLSPNQARLLGLTVAAPLVIIWLIALFGLNRIRHYAHTIQKHSDGKAFVTLSHGLAVLVLSLPLVALFSAGLNYLTRSNPDIIPTTVIITNYISLAALFIGFYIVRKGAKALSNKAKTRPDSNHYRFWQLCLVVFGLLFAYLALNNPARTTPPEGVSRAVYYLPDWLIATTIIIPYIIVWYFGMQSAYYLRHYGRHISGVLYRQAISFIANGIAAIILASMLLRFLTSMTEYFHDAGLKILLMVVYVLIIAISVGYILIAIGARKLQKIEEV